MFLKESKKRLFFLGRNQKALEKDKEEIRSR